MGHYYIKVFDKKCVTDDIIASNVRMKVVDVREGYRFCQVFVTHLVGVKAIFIKSSMTHFLSSNTVEG